MKYDLDVAARLNLKQVLPREGNFITLKIAKDLLEKIELTQEEGEKYKVDFTTIPGQVSWNEDGKIPKPFEITDLEKGVVSDALVKLEKEEKLTLGMLTIYELFVKGNKPE